MIVGDCPNPKDIGVDDGTGTYPLLNAFQFMSGVNGATNRRSNPPGVSMGCIAIGLGIVVLGIVPAIACVVVCVASGEPEALPCDGYRLFALALASRGSMLRVSLGCIVLLTSVAHLS